MADLTRGSLPPPPDDMKPTHDTSLEPCSSSRRGHTPPAQRTPQANIAAHPRSRFYLGLPFRVLDTTDHEPQAVTRPILKIVFYRAHHSKNEERIGRS